MNLDSRKIAAALSFALALPMIAFAQNTIFSAILDKDTYTWGDPITITLTLSPQGEQAQKNGTLLFDAEIKKGDAVCAEIAKDYVVRSETPVAQPFPTKKDSYNFVLPNRRGCTGSLAADIVLKTQDKTQMGNTSIPISMLESGSAPAVWSQKPLTKLPTTEKTTIPIIPIAIILLVVLCAAGYFIWQRKRAQRRTIQS